MSAHEIAAKAALLKVLAEQVKNAKASVDAEIVTTWRAKDRSTAVLGEADLGAVTLVSGRKTARMADEAAFLAWVERVHPDQMETETVTVTRPNPGFVHRLMSAAQKLGVPVDAETGEEVPGITVVTGDPYPMVKLAPDAPALVAGAWQSGEVADLLAGLLRPQLEGGES